MTSDAEDLLALQRSIEALNEEFKEMIVAMKALTDAERDLLAALEKLFEAIPDDGDEAMDEFVRTHGGHV